MARLDRDAVLAAVDLAEVLSREVGAPKRRGSEWWWPSVDPAFAGTGRTPPTHIIPNRHGGGGVEMFKDFASGASGTAVDVLMIRRGVDFAAALEALALEHGLIREPVERARAPGPPSRQPQRPDPWGDDDPARAPRRPQEPDGRSPVVDRAADRMGGGRPGRGRQRVVSAEVAGWVEDCADRLTTSRARGAGQARKWLRQRGFHDETLAANLVGYDAGARHDHHRPRPLREQHGIPRMAGVTFPFFDAEGRLAYIQTRNLRWSVESAYPKYVNPTGLANPRFGVWADDGPRAGAPVVICEGPTDSLTARQAGFDVVGLIGAACAHDPDTAAALLDALGTDRPYVILTDPDTAGRSAAHHLTVELWANGATTVYRPPPGDGDLADWARRHGDRFPLLFADHVDRALTETTAITRQALAGDPAFLIRAAGGPLLPAAAEVWAGHVDAGRYPASPVSPPSRTEPFRTSRSPSRQRGRVLGL